MWNCVHGLKCEHGLAMIESDHPGVQDGHVETANARCRLKRRPIELKRWIVEETFAPGASRTYKALRLMADRQSSSGDTIHISRASSRAPNSATRSGQVSVRHRRKRRGEREFLG